MMFVTAGHVDHGKTSLIQAITGIDTTHLPEEKKRGMTIDLGYAYWPQVDGSSIGFIDVPGHEKFLANMVAGIGGINHALLVIACDDGLMVQTLEHLAILRLAGCPNIIIILTKSDRVSPERIEQVRTQAINELERQGWQQCALFITSIINGNGINQLQYYLQSINEQNSTSLLTSHRFRLAIDRVFSVKGAGLVVTGTALAGQVHIGDKLWLTGVDKTVRVRALHAQNQRVESAQAGDRIALNITGDIDKKAISRGQWLLAKQPLLAACRVLVELQNDVPLAHWQPLHLYHGVSHITGRVSLLNQSQEPPFLAELVLDTPLWLVDNDRLILRNISAQQTLGSAKVIQLHSPRRGKRQPAFLLWLSQLTQATSELDFLQFQLSRGELNIEEYGWARQLTASQLDRLISQVDVIRSGNLILSRLNAQLAKSRLLKILQEYNQLHSDQIGVGRSRLKRMALPVLNQLLAFMLIDELIKENKIIETRGWLHMPDHGLLFDTQQESLWQKIIPLFNQIDPWWVRNLANEVAEDETTIRSLLKKAAQLGLVIAIVHDRYYTNEQVIKFANIILKYHEKEGFITAANFRNELGIGRKLAIQILEFFDKTGFTQRKGDQHYLRDSSLFS